MALSDNDTELTLLSTAFYKKESAKKIIEYSEDIFYDYRNKQVFLAIKDLVFNSRDVDNISLSSRLSHMGVFEKIGGVNYISEIIQHPTTMNAKLAADKLLELSNKRKIIQAKNKIADKIKNSIITSGEITRELIDDLKSIQVGSCDDLTGFDLYDLEDFSSGDFYIKTGFSDIDNHQVGLFCGEFIIIAARPGVGKTTFAINLADRFNRYGKFGLIISAEMSKKQLALKWISMESSIDSNKIKTGNLNDLEKIKFNKAKEYVHSLNVKVSEGGDSQLDKIVSKIYSLSMIKKIDYIIIDYLQLLKVKGKKDMRLEVAEISRTLKLLSGDLFIPVIALSQISREADGKPPKLSDLKESGNLEQDADVVMFLHTEKDKRGQVDIITAKNRNGPLAKYEMMIDLPTGRFMQKYYNE